MYSGELEVQAKRKAIAVLQDEINRILNASRVLSTLPKMLVKKDKPGIKNAHEQISSIEEEVESGSKRFEEIYNHILTLHTEGIGNKEISDYLNSYNIKTLNGKDYTRHLIGRYFYKLGKMNNKLKHSELRITNIRFWVGN